MLLLQAQLPDLSTEVLLMYKAIRPQWFAAVWPAAKQLFFYLALIDFSIAMGRLMLERHSLEEWVSAFLRKFLVLMAFYALLINGMDWMEAIIASFEELGIRGSTGSVLSPGDIFMRGINIGGSIMASSSAWGYLTGIGSSLAAVFAGFMVVIAFTLITTSYMMALIESFIVLTAGMIFLGFGGSSFSQPYVERFIAFAVATGVKIMLLYFLIGTGMVVSNQWLIAAKGLNGSPIPGDSSMAIMGAALMFLLLVWKVPALFSSMLSGAPSLTAGDAIGIGTAVSAATYMGGKQLYAAASSVGGGSAGLLNGAGSSGGSSSGMARTKPLGASVPTSVSPNGSAGGSVGGSSRSSGTGMVGKAARYSVARHIPHEQGHSPAPPRMPIDKDGD